MDEVVHVCWGGRKSRVYILTAVDRASRCIVGWDVVGERTTEVMQALLDRTPQIWFYFSDQFSTYETLVYHPGLHQSLPDKSQTYAVEVDKAELRHYLARLVRRPDGSHVVFMCFDVPLSSLYLPGIVANSTNALIRPVLPIYSISYPSEIRHSLNLYLLEIRDFHIQ